MADFLNPVDMSIAPKFSRFLNYLIDVVAFFLFMVVLGGITYVFGILDWMLDIIDTRFIGDIFSGLLYVGFMFFQEMIFKGRSVGKFVTGTMVVNPDGDTPEIKNMAIRNLCRAIPFEPISFLFSDAGWHDNISGTKVVVKKEFENRIQTDGIDQIGKPEIS